jgi:hypothetical protein
MKYKVRKREDGKQAISDEKGNMMFDEDFKLIKTIEFKPVYPDKDETIDYTKPPNI